MATLVVAVVLVVYEQPTNDLPRNTHLHRLPVSLSDIQVQMEPHPYMRAYKSTPMLLRSSSSKLAPRRAPQWYGTRRC